MIDKIKKEVKQAFNMLAEKEGIWISDKDVPDVELSKIEISYYDFRHYRIFIHPSSFLSAEVYFELAGLALRDLEQKRKGLSHEFLDPHVFDFVGKASEKIGREISKGTDTEFLFEKHKPNLSDEFSVSELSGIYSASDEYIREKYLVKKSKPVSSVVGIIAICVGLFSILFNIHITGNVIGFSLSNYLSIFGIIEIVLGGLLFLKGK